MSAVLDAHLRLMEAARGSAHIHQHEQPPPKRIGRPEGYKVPKIRRGPAKTARRPRARRR